jgi:hypothetical protein
MFLPTLKFKNTKNISLKIRYIIYKMNDSVYYKFCKDHSIFSLFNNANINIQSTLVRPINDNKLFTYSVEHGKLQARYIKEFNSLQQYKDNL